MKILSFPNLVFQLQDRGYGGFKKIPNDPGAKKFQKNLSRISHENSETFIFLISNLNPVRGGMKIIPSYFFKHVNYPLSKANGIAVALFQEHTSITRPFTKGAGNSLRWPAAPTPFLQIIFHLKLFAR